MAKRKDVDPAVVDKMLQDQLKMFADHRKVFVECVQTDKVFITCHVRDTANDAIWERLFKLFELMDVALTVNYTQSPEGFGLEGVAEHMSQYQIAILQKFVECNGVIC